MAWGVVNGQIVDPIGFIQVTAQNTVLFSFFNPQGDDGALAYHGSNTDYVRLVAANLSSGAAQIAHRDHFSLKSVRMTRSASWSAWRNSFLGVERQPALSSRSVHVLFHRQAPQARHTRCDNDFR